MFQRSWVSIRAPCAGWTFFKYLAVKIVMCVWKDKNKWKRVRGWPIFERTKAKQPNPKNKQEVSCTVILPLKLVFSGSTFLNKHSCFFFRHVTKLVPKLHPKHECTKVPKEFCNVRLGIPKTIRKPYQSLWCLDETPTPEDDTAEAGNNIWFSKILPEKL